MHGHAPRLASPSPAGKRKRLTAGEPPAAGWRLLPRLLKNIRHETAPVPAARRRAPSATLTEGEPDVKIPPLTRLPMVLRLPRHFRPPIMRFDLSPAGAAFICGWVAAGKMVRFSGGLPTFSDAAELRRPLPQ